VCVCWGNLSRKWTGKTFDFSWLLLHSRKSRTSLISPVYQDYKLWGKSGHSSSFSPNTEIVSSECDLCQLRKWREDTWILPNGGKALCIWPWCGRAESRSPYPVVYESFWWPRVVSHPHLSRCVTFWMWSPWKMLPNAWLFLFVFFVEYFSYIISVDLSIWEFLALLIVLWWFYLFVCVSVCLWGTGVWTQGLKLGRQAFLPLKPLRQGKMEIFLFGICMDRLLRS
jgi:hypothetical protein